MGGSSKGAPPSPMGPATAGGPTPTLTQAQPYIPNYPTYTPQAMPGLTIPSDVATLRQAAMSQRSPMLQPSPLINRTAFVPRAGGGNAMVRQPPQIQTYAPSVRYTPANPEPPPPPSQDSRTPVPGIAYNEAGNLNPGWQMITRPTAEGYASEPTYFGQAAIDLPPGVEMRRRATAEGYIDEPVYVGNGGGGYA